MTRMIFAAIGFLALAIAVFAFLTLYYPGRRAAAPARREAVVLRSDDARSARLAAQVEELERSLGALKSQMARHDDEAPRAVPTSDVKDPQQTVEEQRALDAERMRTYMTGVEQAFAGEKVDAGWAAAASSRVGNAFDGDEVLKSVARSVECRAQTCRVQIEDDGSGRLSRRMPFVAIGLADVLPTISAQHIDRGNGRSSMVLYLSSQRQGATAGK